MVRRVNIPGDDVLALEGAPPGTQPEQQVLDALGEEELTAMILDLREPTERLAVWCCWNSTPWPRRHSCAAARPRRWKHRSTGQKKMLAQQILQRENDGKECVHGTV